MADMRFEPADMEDIKAGWAKWGIPIVTVGRSFLPKDVEGLVMLDQDDKQLGLVTWKQHSQWAEIVSLEAFVRGHGYGQKLISAAEKELRRKGVFNIRIITTNDNLQAVKVFQRAGYRLLNIHLNAMDGVRKVKPGLGATGIDDIPLRDMWELKKTL